MTADDTPPPMPFKADAARDADARSRDELRAPILHHRRACACVDVPELGGRVYVRPLGWRAMQRIRALDGDAANPAYQARVFAITLADALCDQHGRRLFTDADEPAILDSGALPRGIASVVVAIIAMTRQHNGGDDGGGLPIPLAG